MPNIKGFEAGEVGLRPEDRGITSFREAGAEAQRAGVQEARSYSRAASFYEQGFNELGRAGGQLVQDYQNHEDTLATSDAAMKEADFDLKQHQSLDNIMAPRPDPNDPTGQKMITPDPNQAAGLVGDRLTQWKEDRAALRESITNTKALAQFDKETPRAYAQFANKAYGIETNLNFQAVGNNLVQAAQKNAGVVYADPNQLDDQLSKLHEHIGAMSNSMNMTAPNRMKFQTEFEQKSARALIESAIEGSARLGANGRQHALDLINSGKYDNWIGTDKDKLISHVNTMDRADRADQAAQLKLQQQQEKQQALARTDQYVQDMASDNPKMKLTDIMQDAAYRNRPDLRKEAVGVVETMRKLQSQELQVNSVRSADTARQLIDRITSDPTADNHITDRRQIDQEFINGNLTRQDYNFALGQLTRQQGGLNKELNSDRNTFFKSMERTLDPYRSADANPTGAPSALGSQKIFDAKKYAMSQEAELVKQGKDPRSLYDRNSPNYIGKQLGQFTTSVKDATDFQAQIHDDAAKALQKYAPGAVDLANPQSAASGTPLQIASRYLGMEEHRDQATLAAFFDKAGGSHLDPVTTAWCARFANSVLATAGYQTTGSDAARSFLKYGQQINPKQAQPGDIIVFPRGNNAAKGHVGFIKSVNGDQVEVLSGNHNNRVAVGTYSMSDAIGIRRINQQMVGSHIPTTADPDAQYGLNGDEPYAIVKTRGQFQAPPAEIKDISEIGSMKPGAKFVIPAGKYKGYIGTVPEPTVPMSK